MYILATTLKDETKRAIFPTDNYNVLGAAYEAKALCWHCLKSKVANAIKFSLITKQQKISPRSEPHGQEFNV